MSRMIDKDALLKELGITDEDCSKCDRGDRNGYCNMSSDWTYACDAICTAPTIEERKTGKWERHYSRPNVYADLCWHCSVCGYASCDNWANKFNFCPNCGAMMVQE